MKLTRRLCLLPFLGLFLASCGGGGGIQFGLKALVSPEDAVSVLGAPVGPVSHDSLGDHLDRANHSYQSNCRYDTTDTGKPKRTLSVQGWSWAVDSASAAGQYASQRVKFSELPGESTSAPVEGVGDEAVLFTTGDKKNMALVLRRGNLVLALHASGGEYIAGQDGKITDLARKLLVAIAPIPAAP